MFGFFRCSVICPCRPKVCALYSSRDNVKVVDLHFDGSAGRVMRPTSGITAPSFASLYLTAIDKLELSPLYTRHLTHIDKFHRLP